mmetsp:Transcript_6888/g.22271  ORF Transcript_6888/g.22271 Transcript_6888/m.22271 type:complete len:222 (+) Transcript_6888:436-1101(+)
MGSSKFAVSFETSSVTRRLSWSAVWPSFVKAVARGSVSVCPKRVKARPNSKRPLASSRFRFTRPVVCLATFPIWTSRFVMYWTTSSIFSSAGDLSLVSPPPPAFIVMEIEFIVSSNHDEMDARPVFFSAECLTFCSALAAASPASSAWRKSLKYLDSLSSSWTATRFKNFSRRRRRLSTNSAEKRPTTAFSGRGGTIDPGTSLVSCSDAHRKSEYRRITEN